ncbi:hypothetical protein B0I35DRAFT_473467 [Stachybotrys elegans]|uniref:Putative transcription factor kapC n=1 Tax=Stachybotrys elegans TaxID=80388 RepID=A0A8K0WWL1_9HYPO|nr:hypothetical protein B0I35DRAFT_473467 [Stachybotrys elegans]
MEDDSRPSFSTFWKRVKEKTKEKQVEFIGHSKNSPQDDSSSPHGCEQSKAQDASDKAQQRRAQVRRAQKQHRQRKAEYILKLERDVEHYREAIVQIRAQSQTLYQENHAIKQILDGVMLGQQPIASVSSQPEPEPIALPLDVDVLSTQMQTQNLDGLTDLSTADPQSDLFGNINFDINDFSTVSLGIDEALGTPCFTITSPSWSTAPSTTSPSDSGLEHSVTPEQEQMAINFILALEHVCWDHFNEDHIIAHDEQLEGVAGHTLMASAYCMNNAPLDTYTEARLDCHNNSKSPNLQWQNQGVSLSTLHGLADSLNPSDDMELTPVQAWFEIASRYPPNVIYNPTVLNTLKQEFDGLVKCVYYGAVIDRFDFEAVLYKVLGQDPNTQSLEQTPLALE